MLRKLNLTESEKRQIVTLHNLINEVEQYATLVGKVTKDSKSKEVVPDSKIELYQNDKLIKETKSGEDGTYSIEKIPIGTYDLKLSHENKEYLDLTIPITFFKSETVTKNLAFFKSKEEKEITTKGKKLKRLTLIDVEVFDTEKNPLGPCTIEIYDKDGELVTSGKTDNNGVLQLISIDGETNPKFVSSKEGKPWESKTAVVIKAIYGNVSNQKDFEIILNNGKVIEEGGSQGVARLFAKSIDDEIILDLRETNKFKISIEPLLNYKITVNDEESEEILKTAIVSVYGDKEKTKLLKTGTSPLVGSLKREKLEDLKDVGYENAYRIYYSITNNGYNSKSGKLNLTTKKTNNFEIPLEKIVVKPPKPEKPLSERACLRLTNKHYRNMNNVDAGNITIAELGGIEGIKTNAEEVKECYLKFRKEYPNREKKIINRLMNAQPNLDFFEIKLTKQQVRDIYGESKTMSLKNTIRQVVSESVKIKNTLTEKNLIKQRLKFSINETSNLSESKRALRNERYRLINFGYDKELVRESFLDVMKGLYGNDGTDIISDVKTRLGQRIADQVKNKQEEHEMILSAFNELPTEMIERAIKENRVDELSNEISTKALENYKTQFGTEGLSGIMIASVDENKFKQEVAKLIEPAIKDITTKMDEKLKQVQDVVSGGVNPTA
jgi:hypothetical protein